jgi:hypothetical protein
MNRNLLYKILRYLAQALAIYLIFRFLPTLTNSSTGSQLANVDILMITAIIMLIYILFENLCSIYSEENTNSCNISPLEKADMCSSVCALNNNKNTTIEGMSNISSFIDNNLNKSTDMNIVNLSESSQTPKIYLNNKKLLNSDGSTSQPPPSTLPDNMNNPSIDNLNASIKSEHERQLEHIYYKKYDEQLKSGTLNADDPQIERDGSRRTDGIITNDLQYDTDYNHLPLAEEYDQSRDYEYGYSFLPPSQWYPQPPFPPVCVAEKQCPVCPMYTTGTPVDMKEWNDSTRIAPPDNINTKFIKKLNAGR